MILQQRSDVIAREVQIHVDNDPTATPSFATSPYPLGVTLTPSSVAERAITIPIVPARCDPRAVQEDKRGTVFTLEIGLDGERQTIELYGGDDMRGDILAWVSEWCAT